MCIYIGGMDQLSEKQVRSLPLINQKWELGIKHSPQRPQLLADTNISSPFRSLRSHFGRWIKKATHALYIFIWSILYCLTLNLTAHEEIYSLRSQGPSRPVLRLYGQLWRCLICRHLIQLKAKCFINVCCKVSCRSNLEQVLEVVVIWVTQDMVNLSINNRNDFGQWEIKGWFKLNASNSTKFCWKCQV